MIAQTPIRARAVWDQVRGRWARQPGLGDVCSDGPGAPWSWQRTLYTLNFCNTPYATPPAPPAPTIDLTSAPKSAGSVYAGTDSTGAAVYATPQTAQESQQAIKDNLATFYGGLDVPAPADCSGTFAFLNPVCPSTSALPWLIAGSVIAGMLLMGGRR